MISSKKNYILFSIFIIFFSILFLAKISLAGTINSAGGCDTQSTINYLTQCGESKSGIGDCDRDCCDRDPETGECTDRCWDCSCTGSWDEYRSACSDSSSCSCNTSKECCDKDILIRKCSSRKHGSCPGSCGNDRCCVECEEQVCEVCQSWQKSVREGCGKDCTKWGLIKPECKCCGECIEAPTGLQEYQTPNSPMPAEVPAKLPVKLDWDDVPGFWAGWEGGGGGTDWEPYHTCWEENEDACRDSADAAHPELHGCCGLLGPYVTACVKAICDSLNPLLTKESTSTCPAIDGEESYNKDEVVKFYQIEIFGKLRDCGTSETINYYTDFLDVSEFFAPCFCFFKPDQPYDWHVRGCCKEDANTCGPWSEMKHFETSSAPEPISPYDPDWAGPRKAVNVSATTTLEWCALCPGKDYPTEDECEGLWAKTGVKYYWDRRTECCREYSHQFLTYLIENGKERCHPYLTEIEGQCYPIDLKPFSPGATPDINYHPSKFQNDIYRFFTKNFTYLWQAATCKDDLAKNCTEFGQEWKFSLANFSLEIIQETSPANDPEGKTPIGLPVNIGWLANFGTMSFWYEIYKKDSPVIQLQGTTTAPVIVLDSPPLNLNTIYKWRVKPCWGYYAEPERCDNNWSDFYYFKTTGQPPNLISPENNATEVVIPVKFQWQNIGGAKSYIFEINGKEKIVENGIEITLDYPELLQKESYSWQVKTCARANGQLCGDWSSAYQFTTFNLGTPVNLQPKEGSIISTTDSHIFSWDSVLGAKYYELQIQYTQVSPEEAREECQGELGKSTTEIVTKNGVIHQLKCNGEYQWQVRSCLVKNCEPQSTGDWSPWQTFTLTSKEITQEAAEEILEKTLQEKVNSEVFEKIPEEVSKEMADTVLAKTLEILNNYPEAEWLAQADATPEVPRSALEQALGDIPDHTDHAAIAARVAEIVAEKVEDLVKIMPSELLKRVLARIPEEILKISDPADIPAMVEQILNEEWDKLANEIINQASAIPEIPEGLLADVLSAMKPNVIGKTLDIITSALSGLSGTVEMRKGLVPCGRSSNDPDTSWDETESCQIKHLFILVYVIVNFFLWKVIPIILVLLAIASGVIFYFSLQAENPEPLATVKSLWRAAGIGLAIVFLAWTIISFFLGIFGYQVGLFGPWWRFKV